MPGARFLRDHRRLAQLLLCVAASLLTADQVCGQLRIVNYNIASLNGDQEALQEVFEGLNEDDKTGFALPPHLYIFQEVCDGEAAVLLNLLNAAAPPGVSYSAGTYTNHNENGVAGAQAMFYRGDMLEEITAGHADIYTGAGREADRWKLKLAGYDSPHAVFYIYSAHLKASQGSDNEQIRLEGVIALRDNADSLPDGTHIIFAGDMNFYDNDEPGYQRFLSAGVAQAFDPLGSGSWTGPTNAFKHSQSPRADTSGGLVGGGLDDRFDFQLSTAEMQDGEGLALIEATCRSLGNDGNHYDLAINSGNNTYYPADIPRSNALADALHEASDHLPVVVDHQIPAVMWAMMPDPFGRVIQGAAHNIDVTIMNIVDVVVTAGADELDYTVTGLGGLSGQSAGTIEALGAAHIVPLSLDTSTVGPLEGSALLTSDSQGVQNGSLQLSTTGTIVRPANASFSGASDVDDLTIPWFVRSGTGLQAIEVNVFNYAFDEDQALLDVDAVEGAAEPFQFLSPLPSGIGADPAGLTFGFDTDDAAPGQYEAEILIITSDEDIPGETESTLTLTLVVTVARPGDINGDGIVNTTDLLALLAAWGDCPQPPEPCPADFDGSGAIDTSDLLMLLGNWG